MCLPCFLSSDTDVLDALDATDSDKERLRMVAAEMFAKAATIQHTFDRIITYPEAYSSCLMNLYRGALDADASISAMGFYSTLEDVCPKCANKYLCLLGLAVQEEMGDQLDLVTRMTSGLDNERIRDAIGYVGRYTAMALLETKMQDMDFACIDTCVDGKSIHELRATINYD